MTEKGAIYLKQLFYHFLTIRYPRGFLENKEAFEIAKQFDEAMIDLGLDKKAMVLDSEGKFFV